MGEVLKPGATVAGQSADFKFLKNTKLSDNPNFTRMPKDDRGWSTFVRELEKVNKDESGIFVPTFISSFSVDPTTPTIEWYRSGNLIAVWFNFTTGTSNSAEFSISNWPDEIRCRRDVIVRVPGLVDNGALVDAGVMEFDGDTSAVQFWPSDDVITGGWNATAVDKGFDKAGYCAIYPLLNPAKI